MGLQLHCFAFPIIYEVPQTDAIMFSVIQAIIVGTCVIHVLIRMFW